MGVATGITLMWLSWATKRMKIDDPLDAFAVHFGGGLVGILSTPVFMNGGIVHWQNCESQRANYMLVVFEKQNGDNFSALFPAANPDTDGNFRCDLFEYKVFAWNLAGFIAITVWSGCTSLIVFYSLKLAKMLRVSEDDELRGIDIGKHGEPAYPIEAYGHGWSERNDFGQENGKLENS